MADDTSARPSSDDAEDNALPDADNNDTNEELPAGNAALGGDADGDEDAPDSEDVGPGQHDNAGGVTPFVAGELPATTATHGTAMPTGTVAHTQQQKLDVMRSLSQDAIYLMGFSFILGVLFTVFILLILDFMRRNSNPTEP